MGMTTLTDIQKSPPILLLDQFDFDPNSLAVDTLAGVPTP